MIFAIFGHRCLHSSDSIIMHFVAKYGADAVPYVIVFSSNTSIESAGSLRHNILCSDLYSGSMNTCLNIFSTSAEITYVCILNRINIENKSS